MILSSYTWQWHIVPVEVSQFRLRTAIYVYFTFYFTLQKTFSAMTLGTMIAPNIVVVITITTIIINLVANRSATWAARLTGEAVGAAAAGVVSNSTAGRRRRGAEASEALQYAVDGADRRHAEPITHAVLQQALVDFPAVNTRRVFSLVLFYLHRIQQRLYIGCSDVISFNVDLCQLVFAAIL